MLCNGLLKYNYDLYFDIFTVKLSEYVFYLADELNNYVSLMNGIFLVDIYSIVIEMWTMTEKS